MTGLLVYALLMLRLSLGLLIACTKRTSVFFPPISFKLLIQFYRVFCFRHHCPGDQNTSIKRKTVGFLSASVLEIERIVLLSPTTEVTTIKKTIWVL